MIAVKAIATGTLAERAGFEPGDRIMSINGEKISDLIDFQVHSSEHVLAFEVGRADEVYSLQVERQPQEAIGLIFEEMRLRQCNNKCVFCFLHQMPKGLRRSLYFEDDDYRLSFLHGSYVTLTNVKESDLQRIIDQRLSPQYISVHATDPDVRQRMLGRKKQTVPVLERIERLAVNGIEMHAQVVLCPGWNDGIHLERTVDELSSFYPAVRSVALVPVGLTRFRSHLPALRPVSQELARDYLLEAERWGSEFVKRFSERFVYAADELFLLSGGCLPDTAYYDAFPQLENGIGMVRSFLETWERGKQRLKQLGTSSPAMPDRPGRAAIVTGELAHRFLAPVVEELSALSGLAAELVVVPNDFFGHGISVSGLLTGADISAALAGGNWDVALLPPNCVNGDGLTLDEMTIPELEDGCGLPLRVGSYDLAASVADWLTGDDGTADVGSGRQLSELGFYVGKKE